MARDYKHYGELEGADGRGLYFRAERFAPADLFGGAPAELSVGDAPCALVDMSAQGVGFFTTAELFESDRAPLRLAVGDQVLFQDEVEICWTASVGSRRRAGARFTSAFADLDAIRRAARLAAVRQGVAPEARRGLSAVPERFRALGSETLCLLRRTRDHLDAVEAGEPLSVEDRAQIVEEVEPGVFAALDPLWLEMNAIALSPTARPAERRAMKEFVALTLRPEFMAGPMWRRATEKPLGYPGDFEVMRYCYGAPAGPCSLYGAVMHRIIALRLGACVRGRKDLTRAALEAALGRGAANEPLRVTNLGAGPAQEIGDLLAAEMIRRPLEISLIDQDASALELAMSAAAPHLARHGERAQMRGLCGSFVDILKKGRLYSEIAEQDVIYSLGLIDYFKDASVRSLARGMYDKLRPGGLLALCNMQAGPHSLYLPLDFICDWELIYRDVAQMRAFGEGLGGKEAPPIVDVVAEPSDRVLVLFVRKPEAA